MKFDLQFCNDVERLCYGALEGVGEHLKYIIGERQDYGAMCYASCEISYEQRVQGAEALRKIWGDGAR